MCTWPGSYRSWSYCGISIYMSSWDLSWCTLVEKLGKYAATSNFSIISTISKMVNRKQGLVGKSRASVTGVAQDSWDIESLKDMIGKTREKQWSRMFKRGFNHHWRRTWQIESLSNLQELETTLCETDNYYIFVLKVSSEWCSAYNSHLQYSSRKGTSPCDGCHITQHTIHVHSYCISSPP